MGQRRMFSLTIINTARFLRMPVESQNLYFHLGLRADDDGIVEAFPVMRLIGANDDNLKLLHAKEFIKVLNDDLVTFITDWKEHNTIRADRKIDSIYKNLLVEILPEVQLIEPRERADRKKGRPVDDIGTSHGQPMDADCPHKLSKDKLSKDNLSEVSSSPPLPQNPEITYQKNIGLLTAHISERIKNLLEDGITEDLLSRYITVATERNKRNWSYIEKMAIGNLENNVKTLEQYEAMNKERVNSKQNKPESINVFDQIGKERGYW